MAGKYTGLQKSYRISPDNVNFDNNKNEIPMYRGVVASDDDYCMLPPEDNMTPLGVVDNDERLDDPIRDGGSQAHRQIAVKLQGIAEIKIEGPVTVGQRVILAKGGKAKAVPDSPGVYEVLGFAERTGVDGDVIPVRMAYHVYTIA